MSNIIVNLIADLLRIAYMFLIANYIGLELFILALIIRSTIIRFGELLKRARSRHREPSASLKRVSLVEKLRSAFETSLFYNHVIAVFSIVLLIAAVAELPIAAGVKLQLVPIVASIIPYIWSFTRAANVGVNGGILGVVFGLFWFAWREPNINWWDQAPFFFVLTVVANFSGWLGGWVGGGQTREATAAMIIKIRIGDQGINLPNLIQAVKEKIECKLSEIRPAKRPGLTDHEFHLTLAEGSPSAIVSFKHEIEGWTDKSWLRF